VQLPGVEAVKGDFDEMQGGAGRGCVFRFQGLLVLLALETEPDAMNLAFFA